MLPPLPHEDVYETNQEASACSLLDIPPYYFLMNADPGLLLVTLSKTNSAALATDDGWGLIHMLKLTVFGWGPWEAERKGFRGISLQGCSVLDGSNLAQASLGGSKHPSFTLIRWVTLGWQASSCHFKPQLQFSQSWKHWAHSSSVNNATP